MLSQRDSAGGWEWPLADGLGSVRAVAGSTNAVLETRAYDPYGQPLSSTGTPQTPFGFTGELADGNGLLYLRARHYAPRLGAFPSLDPYEGSAARPMSLNGYSWVEGRVADGRDPSGNCPENPGPLDVFGWRCRFLAEGLAARTGSPVENFMWMDYGQLELLTALGTGADVGGELRQGLDNATMVTQLFLQNPSVTLQALNQALGGCAGAGVTLGSIIHRGESNLQIGLLLVGAALVAGTFLLAYGAIRDATGSATAQGGFDLLPPSGADVYSYNYRLNGFDGRVGTLAEHLAKLLDRDIAGYGPSGPNPDNRATRSWCSTIRRVIREIDGAGYSRSQLSRDLAEARFAGSKWSEIVDAVREVVDRGLCDDHWGDFGGGSLVAS